MTDEGFGGLVLAGGAGRRMGMPKAMARLGDKTLVERAVDLLRPLCSRVVVSSREGVPLPHLDVEVVLDEGGERSAVTGLLTGLSAVDTAQVMVLACDLVVTAGLLERLVAPAGGQAVVVDDHGPQPLLACYDRQRALTACRALIAAGDLRARQLVDQLQPTLVRVEPGELVNVNTPADLARAAALLDDEICGR